MAVRKQREKSERESKRIKVLLSGSSFNLELITASISGKASSLAAYINQILPIFYKAALSPVITEKAKLLFDFRMSESSHEVSPSKMIAGGVTSQVIKPAYHLPFHWKSAQPRHSLAGLIAWLHHTNHLEEGEEDTSCPLTVPAFSDDVRTSVRKHANKQDVVDITELTGMRGSDEEFDLLHPKYLPLPLSDIMTLLLDLIDMEEGRVKQTAVECLIELAGCASWEAEKEDVTALLTVTQNGVDVVRDVAFRGLHALVLALLESGEVLINLLVRRVWVAKCNPTLEKSELAEKLSDVNGEGHSKRKRDDAEFVKSKKVKVGDYSSVCSELYMGRRHEQDDGGEGIDEGTADFEFEQREGLVLLKIGKIKGEDSNGFTKPSFF